MTTIDEEWENLKSIFPKSFTKEEIYERKVIFYGAVSIVFKNIKKLTNNTIESGEKDNFMLQMKAWETECRVFMNESVIRMAKKILFEDPRQKKQTDDLVKDLFKKAESQSKPQ